jgi:hypothetical protein
MALLGSGCTRCGQPYAAQGIRVLAQREEIAFVQLVCFACQTQTLALVTGAPAAEDETRGSKEGILGDAADYEGETAAARPALPISEADVLDMRAYLARYRGDVSGLFVNSPDQRQPGSDGAADETDTAG